MSPPSKPFSFGSNQLTQFIFTWIASPLKALLYKELPPQPQHDPPQDDDPQTYPDSNPPPHPPPLTDSVDPVDCPSPAAAAADPLPTAFMPHFPSLCRSGPLQAAPDTFTRPLPSAVNRRPSRRTLYIGPGHSSMSSSTRLGLARRQRLAMSKAAPETAKPTQPSPSPRRPLDSSPEPSPRQPHSNGPASPFRNPAPSAHAHPLPPALPPPSLRTIKNSNVTPMRPSPLRNVTLASAVSSPSSQRDSSPDPQATPKKRGAASIMSSVVKEVHLEISARSEPTQPSKVINPYLQLNPRPVRKRPATRPAPQAVPLTPGTVHHQHGLQESENRRRKVQVCLDGDATHRPSAIARPIEQMLQKTIPMQFRSSDHADADADADADATRSVPKRKTRHVGKLSERLLKKQRLQEHSHPPPAKSLPLHASVPSESQTPILPSATTPTTRQDTKLGSKTSPGKPLRSSPEKAPRSKPTSPVKVFQQVPSASSLGPNHVSSRSASTRSSLMSAKHLSPSPPPPRKNYYDHQIHGATSPWPDSVEADHGLPKRPPLTLPLTALPADQSLTPSSPPVHVSTGQVPGLDHHPTSKADAQGDATGRPGTGHVAGGPSQRLDGPLPPPSPSPSDAASRAIQTATALTHAEIRAFFDQDLLSDDSDRPSPLYNVNLDSYHHPAHHQEYHSVRLAVLDLADTELDPFVLV